MDKKSIKSFKYDDLEKEVVENLNEKKYRILYFYCYRIFSNILFNLPISHKRDIYIL